MVHPFRRQLSPRMTMADTPKIGDDPQERRIGRNDFLAAALCVAIGVLLAVLPHILWWFRLGSPVWIADYDDLLYLTVASRSYHEHPTYLSDQASVRGGGARFFVLEL